MTLDIPVDYYTGPQQIKSISSTEETYGVAVVLLPFRRYLIGHLLQQFFRLLAHAARGAEYNRGECPFFDVKYSRIIFPLLLIFVG